MFKKFRKNEKGFTLAELLIVVAIIGVLVAISIPIFTSQLEKSRDAVSIANIRAAYAEAASSYLTGASGGNVTVTPASGTTASTAVVTGVSLKGQQSGWSGLDGQLPFTHDAMSDAIGGTPKDNYQLTFEFDATSGACTLKEIK